MGAATISADSHGQMPPGADHLFISYAWEDRVIADWLTLRLTAAGYRVCVIDSRCSAESVFPNTSTRPSRTRPSGC